MIFFLAFFLQMSIPLTEPIPPMEGGGDPIHDHQVCISDEHYAAIEQLVQLNRRQLIRSGLLPKNYNARMAAPGFTVASATLPEEVKAPKEVSIVPNPVRDILYLSATGFRSDGLTEWTLYDLNGKLLRKWPAYPDADGFLQQSVRVDDLPGGLYLLRLRNNQEQITRRLAISR